MSFKFKLNNTAKIIVSGEKGVIVGRAEYTTGENCYCLRYQAGDGRAVETWWGETALAETSKTKEEV